MRQMVIQVPQFWVKMGVKLSFLVRSPCSHACLPVPQSNVFKSVFISLVIAATTGDTVSWHLAVHLAIPVVLSAVQLSRAM